MMSYKDIIIFLIIDTLIIVVITFHCLQSVLTFHLWHLLLEALKKIAPFLGSVSVHCSEEKSVSDDPSAITAMYYFLLFF